MIPKLIEEVRAEAIDLVDEMAWEDSDKVTFLTLEEAGLENLADNDTVCGAQRSYYDEESDH